MEEMAPKNREKILKLADAYDLDLLLLFGSQVTGKTHKESDYDIGYLSRRTLDLDEQGNLINNLLVVIGERDERLINLVNIKKASPLLLYAMTMQTKLLYEKRPALFAALRAFAFKQYVETKPLREEKARRQRERLANS